ncbi:chorismate mutase [Streptomyces sp. NPDC012888]|uniref:chorismate mutase n=1 Tax=Streptomyces sp. NPDC012888 TaxID=3364855 RepID=UPI00368272B6
MPAPVDGPVEQAHRKVAELDDAVMELVRRRTAAHAELVALRVRAGLPATELARENEVMRRYNEALGPSGTALALLLMELARRTRVPEVRIPARPRRQGEQARIEAHRA